MITQRAPPVTRPSLSASAASGLVARTGRTAPARAEVPTFGAVRVAVEVIDGAVEVPLSEGTVEVPLSAVRVVVEVAPLSVPRAVGAVGIEVAGTRNSSARTSRRRSSG